jgi:hypothetical protein
VFNIVGEAVSNTGKNIKIRRNIPAKDPTQIQAQVILKISKYTFFHERRI